MTFLKDNQPEVRQAAAYGCGVLAQVSKIIAVIVMDSKYLIFLVWWRSIRSNLCTACSNFKSFGIGTW